LKLKEAEDQLLEVLPVESEIECQNKLVQVLKNSHYELTKLLYDNRFKIYYMTLLGKAADETQKAEVLEQMRSDHNGQEILDL